MQMCDIYDTQGALPRFCFFPPSFHPYLLRVFFAWLSTSSALLFSLFVGLVFSAKGRGTWEQILFVLLHSLIWWISLKCLLWARHCPRIRDTALTETEFLHSWVSLSLSSTRVAMDAHKYTVVEDSGDFLGHSHTLGACPSSVHLALVSSSGSFFF